MSVKWEVVHVSSTEPSMTMLVAYGLTADAANVAGAALDMLEALRHARTCVPWPSDAYTKIVAAISRAEGST